MNEALLYQYALAHVVQRNVCNWRFQCYVSGNLFRRRCARNRMPRIHDTDSAGRDVTCRPRASRARALAVRRAEPKVKRREEWRRPQKVWLIQRRITAILNAQESHPGQPPPKPVFVTNVD